MHLSMFSPRVCWGVEGVGERGRGGGHTLGIRQPKQPLSSGIRQTTLAQGGGTLDVSARKLKKLCLNLNACPGVF